MNEWNRDMLGRTSQNAKVPDPYQSLWEDVPRESPDKLQIVQTHFQLLGSLTVVFVAEPGLCWTNVQNPVVGDRYFVGIPTQGIPAPLWDGQKAAWRTPPSLFGRADLLF
ncbi:hypothetical protein SAMN03080598_04012 [Algoriphagus boritolerans DSM 17298 = JCM 18970]|uniref:Uncharacterized protein n=1 Tax=Algoriphagus boritolerans DSM 17298 = JCM 18970 TaxID=1120964 RepID=A0A1H6AA01_9BACT|nr:hypothetical protein SAMN03080598_04012 [Algoriphagus boritolerans DSM 17298 = JCM 18970]